MSQFNENSLLIFIFLNFFLSVSAEFSVQPKFQRNFSNSQSSNSFSKRANLSENELFVFFSHSFKLKIQFANAKKSVKKIFSVSTFSRLARTGFLFFGQSTRFSIFLFELPNCIKTGTKTAISKFVFTSKFVSLVSGAAKSSRLPV